MSKDFSHVEGLLLARAGYREKFQNRYTYMQEFTVTEKYRYFLLGLLVSSQYCRFLNFGDSGTSDGDPDILLQPKCYTTFCYKKMLQVENVTEK